MLKYPVYIPSKGRFKNNLTANLLLKYKIPFYLVVEKNDYNSYSANFSRENLLCLESSDYGCVSHARNFIKNHANAAGYKYHWQMDDDIRGFIEVKGRSTITDDAISILSDVERFSDQYSNLAITSLNSDVFGRLATKDFDVNKFAYTCMLILSNAPCTFTPGTEEDLDFNLQCLTQKLCTVKFNKYLFRWSTTGTREGGYTELNANGKRLARQMKTIYRWNTLLKKLEKKQDGFRIVTNQVWKHFKHPLIKKI